MSKDCSLENRISALAQISEKKLLDILDKIPGQKDFIIDSKLIKALEKFVGVSKLRSHGIDKIYMFDKLGVRVTNKQRVYFVRSDLLMAKHVSDQINSDAISYRGHNKKNDGTGTGVDADTGPPSHHVILVPRKLVSIMALFEEEGVVGHVKVYPFQWMPIQLDTKLLTDEFPAIYKSLFLEGDLALLPSVAKTIWHLQMVFGKPYLTLYHGKYAQQIEKLTQAYFEKLGEPDRSEPEISCFYVVDRDVDYASALLTPGTYTSLLDEVFGFNCGICDLIVDAKTEQTYALSLNSTDEIYSQIRNRYFSDVFPFLSSKAKVIRDSYVQSQTAIEKMKKFVSDELRNVTAVKKSLACHIAACEVIVKKMGQRYERLQMYEHNMLAGRNRRENCTYVEDCITMDMGGKLGALRLLSLLSITNDGLTSDELNTIKTQFLQVYGYRYLAGLNNLFNIGLINELPSKVTMDAPAGVIANRVVQAVTLPTKRSSFNSLSQKMKLFPPAVEEYDLKNPKDMSYIFSGAYIPLICQIVSNLVKKEGTLEELVKVVPNLIFRYAKGNQEELPRQTFLVYFIGGVTLAEITAFQLLEKLTGCQIVVVATSVVNGSSLIGSVL